MPLVAHVAFRLLRAEPCCVAWLQAMEAEAIFPDLFYSVINFGHASEDMALIRVVE